MLADFKAAVAARADDLEATFVENVDKAVLSDVELAYMPVLYFQLKRYRKSGQTSETMHFGGPEYLSMVEGARECPTHYLNQFLPQVKCEKRPKKAVATEGGDEGAGELSMVTTTEIEGPYVYRRGRYYDTKAKASKDDLVNVEDVANVHVFDEMRVTASKLLGAYDTVLEHTILQTLLFPIWVVRIPYAGQTFHYYVSDIIAEPSYFNMPYNNTAVKKLEERLVANHERRSALRGVMYPGFFLVLIAGIIAFISGMNNDSWGGDPILLMVAMIGYPGLLIAHIANFAMAVARPFNRIISHEWMEETRQRLEEYEKQNIVAVYIIHLLILLAIAAIVALDLFLI